MKKLNAKREVIAQARPGTGVPPPNSAVNGSSGGPSSIPEKIPSGDSLHSSSPLNVEASDNNNNPSPPPAVQIEDSRPTTKVNPPPRAAPHAPQDNSQYNNTPPTTLGDLGNCYKRRFLSLLLSSSLSLFCSAFLLSCSLTQYTNTNTRHAFLPPL